MTVRLNPYLNFRDTARAAMTCYREVFGGELAINTFKEFGMGDSDGVMHAMLEAPNGLVLMAADTPPDMETSENGSVSLSGDDEATLRGWWDALSAGGTVDVPLEKAPWGDSFGMCNDKFGVHWLVNITASA